MCVDPYGENIAVGTGNGGVIIFDCTDKGGKEVASFKVKKPPTIAGAKTQERPETQINAMSFSYGKIQLI